MDSETIVPSSPVDAVVIAWFRRDASWWSSPDTRTIKRVHVRHPESKSRYGHSRALCGNIALIDEADGGEFRNPPQSLKCKRCLRCLDSSQ